MLIEFIVESLSREISKTQGQTGLVVRSSDKGSMLSDTKYDVLTSDEKRKLIREAMFRLKYLNFKHKKLNHIDSSSKPAPPRSIKL